MKERDDKFIHKYNQAYLSHREKVKSLYQKKNNREKHFEYMRTISDEKFNIFKLKKLIGYQNVLPLMCHFMFKILGLID